LYFKSPFSHKGQFLRTRLYDLLSSKLKFNVVVHDRASFSSSAVSERGLLKDAYAVWNGLAREDVRYLFSLNLELQMKHLSECVRFFLISGTI
jgi:hypothetical protein